MSKKQRFSDVLYAVAVTIAASLLVWVAVGLSSDVTYGVDNMDVSALQSVSDEQLRLQERQTAYNTMKVTDDEFVVPSKDGRAGAGKGNSAIADDARSGAVDVEAETFPLNICSLFSVDGSNILLSPFAVCVQGERVHPPNPGGLPIRAGK